MRLSGGSLRLLIAIISTAALSLASYLVPLEDYVALIPVSMWKGFSWYPYWRVAFVNSLLWIFSALGYVAGLEPLIYLMSTTSVAFTAFHYLSLYHVVRYGVKISFMPFLLLEGPHLDAHLDLGQLIPVLTLITIVLRLRRRGMRAEEPTSGRTPRTPLST